MDYDTSSGSKHIWSVPNKQEHGNLNGVMYGVMNLLVFPCKNEIQKNQNSSAHSKKFETIRMVLIKKDSWLYGRFQRKLINESLDTFLSIQKASHDTEKDIRPLLVKKSKEYRSMIQACISEMNKLLENLEAGKPTPIKEDTIILKTNCKLLYKMELILGLAEIIFIDTQPGGVVLNQLLNWIRLHFPQCRQNMSETLSYDQPAKYPNYWETCYGLILQGLVQEARVLLSHHPDSNKDAFLSIDELLRKMPIYLAYTGVSESEFSVRWFHWQDECLNRRRNGEFSHFRHIQIICDILCGDLPTFKSLLDVMDTWYHLMVSFLFYSNPTVRLHRLSSAAQDAIVAFGSSTPISHLDRLLLAVLEANEHLVLKHCQSVMDNLWFTSHLSDLLFHAVDKHLDRKFLKEMRESFLIDYGSELASHHSLWQVGLSYLDAIGPLVSIPYVEGILERVPLSSDSKAFAVIHAASERNLDTVAMGVCRVMGRKMLRDGHLGAAVWWGVRSQDAPFTSHLAHKILHKYMEEGQIVSSSLLDHLGPAMLLSDTLTFLSKYREFHTLYQEGQIQAAASLLVSLIASRLAPEYFWPVLLEDALPLLQFPDPVITADQTYKLMYCLHNLSINVEDSSAEAEKKNKLYASFLDKEQEVRLALTNNLARAIIQEGTVDY